MAVSIALREDFDGSALRVLAKKTRVSEPALMADSVSVIGSKWTNSMGAI